MSVRPLPGILARLAELQARRPWLLVLIATLSIFPALWAAKGLTLKADFAELLPDNKDSVIESRKISKRLAGASTLTVVAEIADGHDRKSLETFVDKLVPALQGLGPEWVGAVDYGVQDTRKFFEERKLYFAPVDELKKAHDEIEERWKYEVTKSSGGLVDDVDPPPPINADTIKRRIDEAERKRKGLPPAPAASGSASSAAPSASGSAAPASSAPPAAKKNDGDPEYPDGYYMNPEGTFIAVLVRTPVSGKAKTEEFKSKVANVVAQVNPTALDPTMHVRYTGDIITSAEEYDAIIRDLQEVGVGGVIGVLASVLLFFLRARVVMVMGYTILIGLAWTFGVTRYAVGYLTSSTGFLVSIIAGNGINYGIMYMARYIEARRDESLSVEDAIRVAHRDSWVPTLSAAATAALAYGSLVVTDFRGFKHFGVIGGYGMILCWLSTYIFTPAVLAASEGVLPAFKPHDPKEKTKARGYYGIVFAKLAQVAPRTVTLFGAAIGIVSVVLSAMYLANDPIEYNMKKIRNERKDETVAGNLSHRVDAVVGRIGQDGMAIMTDRVDQVPMLEAELKKRYDAAPENLKPFEKIVSIFSLMPEDQDAKLPLIKQMRERIQKSRSRGFINDNDWKDIEPYLPKGEIKPITIAELPEQVARSFTERDGTRGRIVYIAPKSGFSVWDAKYLMRWADSFRSTTLPTGEVIKGSGRAVIFADIILTIREDAPKAIAVSSIGTIIVLIIAFRLNRHAWGVFLPWLMGISSLMAFLYLIDMKLNFLNFVGIPITIGIGAEYAHNLMQRYIAEGDDQIQKVVTETGGAVILCSMTTTIGYLALLMSINQGIVSFGTAAAAGEITCILAAVLVLPSALTWMAQRRAK
ncbi:MAG: MMPL family transporter [Polyangiaceae bacterium]